MWGSLILMTVPFPRPLPVRCFRLRRWPSPPAFSHTHIGISSHGFGQKRSTLCWVKTTGGRPHPGSSRCGSCFHGAPPVPPASVSQVNKRQGETKGPPSGPIGIPYMSLDNMTGAGCNSERGAPSQLSDHTHHAPKLKNSVDPTDPSRDPMSLWKCAHTHAQIHMHIYTCMHTRTHTHEHWGKKWSADGSQLECSWPQVRSAYNRGLLGVAPLLAKWVLKIKMLLSSCGKEEGREEKREEVREGERK